VRGSSFSILSCFPLIMSVDDEVVGDLEGDPTNVLLMASLLNDVGPISPPPY
jgi:hypothetical protein